MSPASSEAITIDWATVDIGSPMVAEAGADFVSASGSVTFAPGETIQYVPIEVLGDTDVEAPLLWGEWGLVQFSNPSANAVLNQGFFGAGLFIIFDDD